MASDHIATDLDRPTVVALARLARRWDLGELHGARLLAEGTMNRNFRIQTSTGVWFAKQYLDAEALQVAAQHRTTRALAARGLPVPTPLSLPDAPGRTLVTSQGRPATIYPWVAGQHRSGLTLPLVDCARLGGLLGRLHLGLGTVLRPVQQTFLAPVPDVDATLASVDTLLAVIQAKRARDEFDELAAGRLAERRRLLQALCGRRPSAVAMLTVGWSHGDFHGLNLLYGDGGDGTEVVAILDWDRLGIQAYAYELARAATLLFGYGDERGLDLARVRGFVGGYRAVVPLERAELAAVAHRLWWLRLNDLWMLEWHFERGDTSCDHLFAGAASLVAWWTRHDDQVTSAFAEA